MKDWKEVELTMTCQENPERYDVCIEGNAVGYLRLKWGYFAARYKGETVYRTATQGVGSFNSDERAYHLKKARKAIAKAHKKAMRAKVAKGSKDAAWVDLKKIVEAEIGYSERQDMVRSFITNNAKKLLPIIKKLAE